MALSRILAGGFMILAGFVLLIIPFFFGGGFFLMWIYGIPLLVLGIFVLVNKKEDEIEQIKSRGGKRK